MVLVKKEDKVMLGTNPELSALIEKMLKEELDRDLGKAGSETLALVLYRGPVTKTEIDYVRGVNSQFILRNLLIRGLVERVSNPKDNRSYLYKPTFELLSYLGITDLKELPEYESYQTQIKDFLAEEKDDL